MMDKWVCGQMDELDEWEDTQWVDKWVGGQVNRWVCGMIYVLMAGQMMGAKMDG